MRSPLLDTITGAGRLFALGDSSLVQVKALEFSFPRPESFGIPQQGEAFSLADGPRIDAVVRAWDDDLERRRFSQKAKVFLSQRFVGLWAQGIFIAAPRIPPGSPILLEFDDVFHILDVGNVRIIELPLVDGALHVVEMRGRDCDALAIERSHPDLSDSPIAAMNLFLPFFQIDDAATLAYPHAAGHEVLAVRTRFSPPLRGIGTGRLGMALGTRRVDLHPPLAFAVYDSKHVRILEGVYVGK